MAKNKHLWLLLIVAVPLAYFGWKASVASVLLISVWAIIFNPFPRPMDPG